MTNNNKPNWDLFVSIGVPILLLIGLAPLPYGYYTFLRILVCASCIYLAKKYHNRFTARSIIFGLLGILYNPIIPIHLTREIWTWLNPLTCLALLSNIPFSGTDNNEN
jgi:uncharacterized protein DUF6804